MPWLKLLPQSCTAVPYSGGAHLLDLVTLPPRHAPSNRDIAGVYGYMANGAHPLKPILRLLAFGLFIGLIIYALQIVGNPAAQRPGAACMPWYRVTVLARQTVPHFFFPNHPDWQHPYAGTHFYEACTNWARRMPGFHGANVDAGLSKSTH